MRTVGHSIRTYTWVICAAVQVSHFCSAQSAMGRRKGSAADDSQRPDSCRPEDVYVTRLGTLTAR